jgi:hypothetical protein
VTLAPVASRCIIPTRCYSFGMMYCSPTNGLWCIDIN